jgi:hypothetical protein
MNRRAGKYYEYVSNHPVCHLFSVTCFLALLPIGRLDRQRLRGWRYCPQTGLSLEKGLQESGRKFDC